jgi:CDP-diacylglycerol--serine O-phosphatidyltransferase
MKENQFGSLNEQYWLIMPWVLGVGVLMISKLPTLSLKKIRFSRDYVAFVLLGAVLVAALLITIPWLALSLLLLAYLASLPVGAHLYRKAEARYKASLSDTATPSTPKPVEELT